MTTRMDAHCYKKAALLMFVAFSVGAGSEWLGFKADENLGGE